MACRWEQGGRFLSHIDPGLPVLQLVSGDGRMRPTTWPWASSRLDGCWSVLPLFTAPPLHRQIPETYGGSDAHRSDISRSSCLYTRSIACSRWITGPSNSRSRSTNGYLWVRSAASRAPGETAYCLLFSSVVDHICWVHPSHHHPCLDRSLPPGHA